VKCEDPELQVWSRATDLSSMHLTCLEAVVPFKTLCQELIADKAQVPVKQGLNRFLGLRDLLNSAYRFEL
jgi:hypothetical protein